MTESHNPDTTSTTSAKKTETPAKTETAKISVSQPTAVVGNGDTDVVKLSAIKFKNKFARKSLSVHHLQRRLNELGFSDAFADVDGYFGDLTRNALIEYQKKNDLDQTGDVSEGTLTLLFEGDPNVSLDLS